MIINIKYQSILNISSTKQTIKSIQIFSLFLQKKMVINYINNISLLECFTLESLRILILLSKLSFTLLETVLLMKQRLYHSFFHFFFLQSVVLFLNQIHNFPIVLICAWKKKCEPKTPLIWVSMTSRITSRTNGNTILNLSDFPGISVICKILHKSGFTVSMFMFLSLFLAKGEENYRFRNFYLFQPTTENHFLMQIGIILSKL